jgi:hypothetical protein
LADPQATTARPTVASSPKGISIVDFAVQTTHQPGTAMYPRQSGKSGDCASYSTPDFAQFAFLNQGGPQIDTLSLDPDGDGFACGWSPVRLRAAMSGKRQG